MALRGTVVGMATAIDLRSHRLASASDQDVSVSVLTVLAHRNAAEIKSHNSNTSLDPSISANFLVFVNRRLSHETMLEAMALGIEVRTRAFDNTAQTSEGSLFTAGASGLNCVAVSTYEDPSLRYRGDHDGLKQLLQRAFAGCLSG
jgi:adenosylcobinamide amidohydrolase